MAAALSVETLLAPADRARHAVYRLLGPWAGPWAANRERRVAWMGALLVLLALASTVTVPLWMLALGPIVLGVPHIVADVRYLVVRPGYHERGSLIAAAGVPLAIGAITGEVIWAPIAASGALLVARCTQQRRIAGLLLALPLAVLCARFSGYAELAFAHLHNVIALALWWAYRPRKTSLHAIPLALFAALTIALLCGLAEPLLSALGTLSGPEGSTSLRRHLASLAPFAGPELGLRLVLAYAFAQAVHYAVWLRLLPEDDRARQAPRSFTSSWRALRDDLGLPLLAIAFAVALGIAAWAAVSLAAARTGYLRFAVFHGQLELAAAALLWAERRGSQRPTREPRRC